MNLTSRERIRRALEHRSVDRTPVDLGSSPVTGIAASAYGDLMKSLGVDTPLRIATGLQLAYVDAEVQQRLQCDVRRVGPVPLRWTPWEFADGTRGLVDPDLKLSAHADGSQTLEIDGGGRLYMPPNGWFFDPVSENAPLADLDSPRQVRDFFASLPVHPPEEVQAQVIADARRLDRDDEFALFGDLPTAVFECWQHRGFEKYLMDFLAQPDVAQTLMEVHAEYWLEYWRPVMEAIGPLLDVVWVSDDLGSQNDLIISRSTYREMVKPIHREVWAEVKRRAPNAKLFLHSCGAIAPLIPDFIECGVDVLNPVQLSARGMHARDLKREYGNDITFWGGGVDTQHVLQRGSAEQIRAEVRKNVADLGGAAGGYVFATVHDIQPDTPAPNVLTAFEAAIAQPAL